MINIKINRSRIFLLSIIIFICDQLTKRLIVNNFNSFLNKNFILFSLDYVKNYGAAFNLFEGNKIFLSIVSVLVSIFLIFIIIKRKYNNQISLLSYSLILSGTIGNGFDRITMGYVIDFINLNFINFPVFNIADISINIGFLLLIYSFFKNKK